MRRLTGFRTAAAIAIMTCLSLAGCADESAGPQFASDPIATRLPTSLPVIASPVPSPTVAVVATPASIGDLLATRGAVSRIFVSVGQAIWSVGSDGEAARVFQIPAGWRLVGFTPSPDASQVAALLRADAENAPAAKVVILSAAGQEIAQFDELVAGVATPVPAEPPVAEAIDWSPQGDRLLVSLGGGAIVILPVAGGAATTLDVDHDGERVIAPEWSPTGQSIAFIAVDPAGDRTLSLLDVADGTVSEVVRSREGRIVVEFAWMPDGISLLFTEGGKPGAATTGVDLWRVHADGEARELVASAGTVAPVARITDVRPSPDGRSVAYAVLVPGASGPQIDSIWVRDLASRLGFKVTVPSVDEVDTIWWTDRGLALAVEASGAEANAPVAQALLQITRDGSIAVLWAAPVTLATPVNGTPVALPATPAANAASSPV